ncbi:NAD(P)-binding protein [Melanomma pulvis-pyrius CBS 109.77]|uniref:NAD(P)-binding protein n=1 Tax=Melanomma pulvis-pyrius CBS 109.77 TaxID=1314802 RepID=A0A6A6XHT9_9PLEO|nr:NAD(P)-binding protein [Melanomma pulvis-pyrius CBS 109.77]
MATTTKTVLFLGASTGVGLSALKHTLSAGHRCIALCRVPSKLTAIFPPGANPNIKIIQGNAHDLTAVSKSLLAESGNLVDEIVSTIGGAFNSKMAMDQPDICGKGMKVLLEALAQLRSDGVIGNPHIVVCGTTGMSRFGRDVPLPMVPVYSLLLKGPIKDKKVMEALLIDSGESYTIVHASHLTTGETSKEVRVGIDDPKTGREVTAIGYAISREDAGKWIAHHLVLQLDGKYVNKIVGVTN